MVFDGKLSLLKDEVLKTKILDVKFKEKIKEYKAPEGIKIVDRSDMSVKLEVDREKHAVDRVLNFIIKN